MHPMQRDCPRDDPKKFAAWAWAGGIPDPSPVRPAPIPLISPQLCEGISQMLWDFGFRHHPTKQTKWISGGAGIGMVAEVTATRPKRDKMEEAFEEFLSDNNPKLMEAIKKAPPEERDKLLQDLEKNHAVIGEVLKKIKGMDE